MFSFNDQSLLQDPTHLPESSSMMCAGPWYEQISEQHFFNNASWSTTIVHNTQLQKTHQNDIKSSSRGENSQRVKDSNAVYWKRQLKLLYFPLHWKNTTTVKRSCSRFIISINKLGHLFLYFIFIVMRRYRTNVSHSVTLLNRLDWCDPGEWRYPL